MFHWFLEHFQDPHTGRFTYQIHIEAKQAFLAQMGNFSNVPLNFWWIFPFLAEHKIGCFSLFPSRIPSVGQSELFFVCPGWFHQILLFAEENLGTFLYEVPIPKKTHNSVRRPENGSPSSQMGTYRKTKGIQSYLRIWWRYDPIESGPSEPKKWELRGCSVKKSRFLSQKWDLAPAWETPLQHCWHKKWYQVRI